MILNAVVLQNLKEPKDIVILTPTGPNNILVLGEVLKVVGYRANIWLHKNLM